LTGKSGAGGKMKRRNGEGVRGWEGKKVRGCEKREAGRLKS